MKKFRECMFPGGCSENSMTTRMNKHHIKAKSLGGQDVEHNYFHVCPNHHNKIYIEGTKNGIHSNVVSGSIILHETLDSTCGKVLRYTDCGDGKDYLYYYSTKEKVIYSEENVK